MEEKRRKSGASRGARTAAAIVALSVLFAFFCVGAVERARRAAESDGLVATRTVPARPASDLLDFRLEKQRADSVFVPFDSPRAQAAADRAVGEFWRTAFRRADSPESRAVRRAQIAEARRRFATSDVAAERRATRTADARSAVRAVDAFLDWDVAESSCVSWESADFSCGAADFGDFERGRTSDAGFNDYSAAADARPGERAEKSVGFKDFDGQGAAIDADLAAAIAFLNELSDEPAATSVPTAPLSDLDAPGDFRDAVVFLDANAFVPVSVPVEAVLSDAAPRTFGVVGALQAFVAFLGAAGARFFAVDWARFFSIWNRGRRGWGDLNSPSRTLSFREPFGASGVLAELAVVRLLR